MSTVLTHRKQFKEETDKIIQESLNEVLYAFRDEDKVVISIYRMNTPDGVPLSIRRLDEVLILLEDDGFKIQERIVVDYSRNYNYYVISLPETK
jgi:hypothetical protein